MEITRRKQKLSCGIAKNYDKCYHIIMAIDPTNPNEHPKSPYFTVRAEGSARASESKPKPKIPETAKVDVDTGDLSDTPEQQHKQGTGDMYDKKGGKQKPPTPSLELGKH